MHLCSREIQIRAPFDLCGLPFVLEVGISKFRSSTTPELDIKMAAKGVNDKQSTRPSVLLVLVQKWLPTGWCGNRFAILFSDFFGCDVISRSDF